VQFFVVRNEARVHAARAQPRVTDHVSLSKCEVTLQCEPALIYRPL
jgi:hypothetical protein